MGSQESNSGVKTNLESIIKAELRLDRIVRLDTPMFDGRRWIKHGMGVWG